MARRIIHECDLTKQEFNPDEDQVFILRIAKKGKRDPMKYELSAAAAEKLLAQLNGSVGLPEDWSFARPIAASPQREHVTLGDLEDDPDSDARFVSEKKAQLREAGIIEEESSREMPEETITGNTFGMSKSKCPTRHMNKGRIQTTMRDGHRFIYRVCSDCRQRIPEKTADDKKSYRNQKTPKGVNVRDIN